VEYGAAGGQVAYRGKPVTEGTVTFYNLTSGYTAEARLGPDGSYTVTTPEGGLEVGDYVVTVNPPIVIDNSDPKTPPSQVEKPSPNIPPRYRTQGSTPLKATVQKGSNTFNFDMK
jgi:hypothetical protein